MAKEVWADEISRAFITTILVCFVVPAVAAIIPVLREKFKLTAVPGFLTSIGILGTFVGILIGLDKFKSSGFEEIEGLLTGLTIAFATSIAGLFFGLLFRVFLYITGRFIKSKTIGVKDLYQELVDINRYTRFSFDEQLKATEETSQQLTSINENIEKLAVATGTGFNKLDEAFKDFAKQLSQAFSDAFISELRGVIREFNEKMSEQFGENFNRFNQAVENLLKWQEEHKAQIVETTYLLRQAVGDMERASNAISEIEREAAKIHGHVDRMAEANEHLHETLGKLDEALQSVATMREKAEGAFPAISDKIDEIADSVGVALQSQQQASQAILANISTITSEFDAAIKNVTKTLGDSVKEQEAAQKQLLDGLQKAIGNILQDLEKRIKDAVEKYNASIDEEVHKVVQMMVNELASVTRKFVDDYKQYIKELRQLMEQAKRDIRKPTDKTEDDAPE